MHKYLIVFLAGFLGGCAGYSYTHVHVNGNGTYIYNGLPVNGNVWIDTHSCIGKCPAIKNTEVINADYPGSTNNTAK